MIEHISNVYAENSAERIYFVMLYNIFSEFLEDIDEDVLPNDRTGYEDTVVWKKLFNFQRDAAVGLINKLETYNGCILADSVGLGKTFTALAVIKYYELRNKSVLVLCPKKLSDNWLTYNSPLKTNVLAADRLNYDVLNHTDLQRTSGESYGMPLNQINWGNFDLVVIDESHNFRNNKPGEEEKESRYERLMKQVVRAGVKTKVLMLSATPVNNRFSDLKNQLALAYEGESETLRKKLKHRATPSRRSSAKLRPPSPAGASWSRRTNSGGHPQVSRFRVLRAARQRHHRPLPQAHRGSLRHHRHRHLPDPTHPDLLIVLLSLTREDVDTLRRDLRISSPSSHSPVYTPGNYILPSRKSKYEQSYGDDLEGISRNVSLSGQQKGIKCPDDGQPSQAPRKLRPLLPHHPWKARKNQSRLLLDKIAEFQSGNTSSISFTSYSEDDFDPDDDDIPDHR